MSPAPHHCILCGFPVLRYARIDTRQWLAEFRAICFDPSGDYITGVGCYNGDDRWIAPNDSTLRWDDEDYRSAASSEIPLMPFDRYRGRHGFLLHDSCWRLLEKVFEGSEIPVKRLVEVCESLPHPYGDMVLNWGHDYGGLLELTNRFPWEEYLVTASTRSAALEYAKDDPYRVPEIPSILTECLRCRPEWAPKAQARDCFSRLPWEILEAIAISLCTADALTLRLASISFVPLLSSRTFWASNFEANGERGFLFEKRRTRDTTDWLSLYRRTGLAACPPGLRNRQRIWPLIKPLAQLANSTLAEHPILPTDQKLTSGEWIQIGGKVNPEASEGLFSSGCRSFGTHVIRMPEHLLKIALSIASFGTVTHLTGIRLVTTEGPDVPVGYIFEGDELMCQVTEPRGFRVAVAASGIRALQVIGQEGNSSEWFGCPEESPISERLADFSSIGSIAISSLISLFKGFKILLACHCDNQRSGTPQFPKPN
ncbi:MAG: hypothetical protein M1837_002402 [Sclerophora amabilis]|nr:MAG: hypothetical protein M1837_002402 [Sclerophora amabilis]